MACKQDGWKSAKCQTGAQALEDVTEKYENNGCNNKKVDPAQVVVGPTPFA